MARVGFDVDYIAFIADYTEAIVDNENGKMRELEILLKNAGLENKMSPLYVMDDKIYHFPLRKKWSKEETENYKRLNKEVSKRGSSSGYVVFTSISKTNLNDMFTLYRVFQDLHYCEIYGLDRINVVKTTEGARLAIIKVDSEAG